MNVNLVGFDVNLGKNKPRTLIDDAASCPFCDVAGLTNIIDRDGAIILLRNKYNVLKDAEQFVLIENDVCKSDMPDYTREHMRRLIAFGLKHWQRLLASRKYEEVLFFKNYGPLSGGTVRHPHMQLVGFPHIKRNLLFDEDEFCGIPVGKKDGVALNVATCPRIGFGELNIVPEKKFSVATLADFIQICTDYLMKHFSAFCTSYNIFFYDKAGCGEEFLVKILPRFATSPLFVGYNIRFLPNNLEIVANEMREYYDDVLGG